MLASDRNSSTEEVEDRQILGTRSVASQPAWNRELRVPWEALSESSMLENDKRKHCMSFSGLCRHADLHTYAEGGREGGREHTTYNDILARCSLGGRGSSDSSRLGSDCLFFFLDIHAKPPWPWFPTQGYSPFPALSLLNSASKLVPRHSMTRYISSGVSSRSCNEMTKEPQVPFIILLAPMEASFYQHYWYWCHRRRHKSPHWWQGPIKGHGLRSLLTN